MIGMSRASSAGGVMCIAVAAAGGSSADAVAETPSANSAITVSATIATPAVIRPLSAQVRFDDGATVGHSHVIGQFAGQTRALLE